MRNSSVCFCFCLGQYCIYYWRFGWAPMSTKKRVWSVWTKPSYLINWIQYSWILTFRRTARIRTNLLIWFLAKEEAILSISIKVKRLSKSMYCWGSWKSIKHLFWNIIKGPSSWISKIVRLVCWGRNAFWGKVWISSKIWIIQAGFSWKIVGCSMHSKL